MGHYFLFFSGTLGLKSDPKHIYLSEVIPFVVSYIFRPEFRKYNLRDSRCWIWDLRLHWIESVLAVGTVGSDGMLEDDAACAG